MHAVNVNTPKPNSKRMHAASGTAIDAPIDNRCFLDIG
jgi:hypothetical protein